MAELVVEKKSDYAKELLSVTNAAIHALDPKHSYSHNASRETFFSGDISIGAPSQECNVNSHNSMAQEHNDAIYNASFSSKASSKSQGSTASSTFLSGQAKLVKVSRKKLREIKSPFSDTDPIDISGPHLSDGSGINHSTGRVIEGETRDYTLNSENHSKIDANKHDKSQAEGVGDQMYEKRISSDLLGTNEKGVVDARPMLDSGYMTQNVQVIREVQEELGLEQEHVTSDMSQNETASTGSPRNIDISCNQPDIVTVPEKIVTVNAHTTSSVCSGSELNTSTSTVGSSDLQKENFRARLAKYHPSVLKQGSVIQEGVTINPAVQPSGEVRISQFHLSDKEKILKNSFMKRQTEVGAVKRSAQPKLVQHRVVQQAVKQQQEEPKADAVTAAAIAAASAVAATQPFLQAQYTMEQRLAAIMQQLSTIPQSSALEGSGGDIKQRLVQLEDRVGSMTQQRLDNLEKMQIDCQAHLLAISRQRPTDSHGPGSHLPSYGHAADLSADSSHIRPYTRTGHTDKYGTGGSQTSLYEEKEQILDTPAPRKCPPRPTAYNKTAKADAVTLHSPEQHAKKFGSTGVGSLLAEILASQEETPSGPNFPDTPPARNTSARQSHESNPVVKSTLQQASDLVGDLDQLKSQMQDVVQGGGGGGGRYFTPAEKPMSAELPKTGPAPLDVYLMSMKDEEPPGSPYPSLEQLMGPHNKRLMTTPPGPKYHQAAQVLQHVQKTRTCLEANLQAIQRGRQEPEVFSLLSSISRDSSLAEKMRIRKRVDDLIQNMNEGLQQEVMEELARMQEEEQTKQIMIPERDTSVPKVKVQAKTGVTSRLHNRPPPKTSSRGAIQATAKVIQKENKLPPKKKKVPTATLR